MELGLLGVRSHERVAGMEILLAVCKQAEAEDVGVFFLGSTPEILSRIRQRLCQDFPSLKVSGMEALPFRKLTSEEDTKISNQINQSGAGIVFVSLGCPKQEWWMYQHKEKINAVMIGIGGAFPVYAEVHKWAPRWVQKMGLEWLYRLRQEPRRLWRRYATTIPPFVFLASKQIAKTYLGLSIPPGVTGSKAWKQY